MIVAVALTAMLVTQQAAPDSADAVRLTSYEEALHCAGLTQAASELEGGETPRGRRLYDAALYWSLATIQTARFVGRDPVATEQAMTSVRIRAVKRLSNGEASLRENITECVRKAPTFQ